METLFEELNLDYGDRFNTLKTAVQTSYKSLEPFRNLYKSLVECYAGPAYGDPEDKSEVYVNKLAQFVDAWTMLLAANRPRVDISTRHKALKPFAVHYEAALNDLVTEIGLEHTIRRWVLDAFFCAGIVKVHLKDSAEIEFENNIWMDPGTPFASNVSLYDFVCDMSVKNWAEMRYAGNMYQISLSDLKEGIERGLYDKSVASQAVARCKSGGDEDRLEHLTRDSVVEPFEKSVDLADIWIASEGKVLTFLVENRNEFIINQSPIAEMEWTEPDCSPYHLLGFNDVPDNIMPVSPTSHLNSLARLINNLYRKAARAERRRKTNLTFAPGGKGDATTSTKANDGETIAIQDPSKLKIMEWGGAAPESVAFLQGAMQDIDESGGNVPLLLGTGQQADTLGQEELLHTASNRKVGQMQYRVFDAVRLLLRSLGYMLWEDQFKEVVTTIPVTGDYEAQAHWKPGDREGNFLDYNFAPNVYSMAYRPPAAQAQMLDQLLQMVYMPMGDMLMQQGGVIDMAKLAQYHAEKYGLEEMEDIIKFSAPPAVTGPGPTTETHKPPVTSREYTRNSVAKPTNDRVEKQKQWMQMASGRNQQSANGIGG